MSQSITDTHSYCNICRCVLAAPYAILGIASGAVNAGNTFAVPGEAPGSAKAGKSFSVPGIDPGAAKAGNFLLFCRE